MIDQRILNPLLYSDTIYKLTTAYWELREQTEIIHEFVNNVIETRRNEIIQKQKTTTETKATEEDFGTKKRNALMDLLLQSNMDGEPLSNDDIKGEVNTFMLAGHETTTAASQFCLYLLAKYPDKQELLYREIREKVLDAGESLSIRLINSLMYLDMCIKESLRIYPPVPSVGKWCEDDIKIGKTTIPKKTIIIPYFYHNHHNPKYFPEPEKFIPERFNEEVTTFDRNPYVYTPFSFGLRNCIGRLT